MNAREHLEDIAGDLTIEDTKALRDINLLLMDAAWFIERIHGTFLEPQRMALRARLITLGYSPEDKNG